MVWKNKFGGVESVFVGYFGGKFLAAWLDLFGDDVSHPTRVLEARPVSPGFFHAPKMEESCFVNYSKKRGRKDAFSPTHFWWCTDSTVIGWFFGFELISCIFFSTDQKKPLRFIALPQNQDTVKGTGYTQLLSWIGLGGCVFSSIHILEQSASCLLPTPKHGEALKGVFVPQWMSGTINST